MVATVQTFKCLHSSELTEAKNWEQQAVVSAWEQVMFTDTLRFNWKLCANKST